MAFVLTGLDIEAKADLVRRQLETEPDGQAGRDGVDAGPHRPRRRRHRGGRERAAALRGARSRPRERRAPILLGGSRTRAGQLSRVHHAPRRRATVRCTACSRRATSTPPRCHTSPCTPTAPAPTSPPPTETKALEPVADPFALPEPLPFGRDRGVPARPHRRRAQRRQGRQRQRRRVGPHRRPVAVAGAHADRREATRIAARDSRSARHPPSVAEPAGGQLRHRGHPRQGVAYQARFDPQAKGLGEWLRSRTIDIPRVVQDIPEEFPTMSVSPRAEHESGTHPNASSCERPCAPSPNARSCRTSTSGSASGDLPRELHRKAGEAGLLGAGLPEAVGGGGGDGADAVIICEEMHYAGAPGGVSRRCSPAESRCRT